MGWGEPVRLPPPPLISTERPPTMTAPKPTLVLSALVVATLAGGFTAAIVRDGSPGTKVLAEKVQGVGTSGSSSAGGNGQGNNGNGNGNGGGNATPNGGSTPTAKVFSIAGTVTGLYPGGTVQLHLST